jgi:filamentous hemagglutinin family protein
MAASIAKQTRASRVRALPVPRLQRTAPRFDRRRGRRFLFETASLYSLLILSAPVFAAPQGGSVVAGQATISQSGSTTNINQSSNNAVINWQGFSIGASETVNFNQPSSSSATLNRVVGNEQSVISGALNANGQVFIVNSNGIIFTKNAQVNVGGLVASTLDISNQNFMSGTYVFEGDSTASVLNRGHLQAHDGGYISLLGTKVVNDGIITATLGTVAMASGEKITLNFNGDSLIDVTIDKGAYNALVSNKRLIVADGGQVILTARAADQIVAAQVNNSGIIQARTMAGLEGGSVSVGKIKLIAYGGKVAVSGKLDASAPDGGNGGAIETSGDQVNIADSAVVTTKAANGANGTWLIDPTNFTIAASGGDITGTLLSAELQLTNVVLTTAMGSSGTGGNLYVDDSVSWSSGYSLTLTAANNLYVNSAITASGDDAGLTLTATGGSIYVNAPITLSGAYDTMVLNANTTSGYVYVNNAITLSGAQNDALTINALDYVINTKASYSGTTTDSSGNVVAVTDTSGGTYGSINFTSSQGSASNDSLTINGHAYTLIYSASQLDGIDMVVNGKYYDPVTGKYDVSTISIENGVAIKSGSYYYDPATGKYDIINYNSANGLYWDPLTQTYDLTKQQEARYYGAADDYYYDSATGLYDILGGEETSAGYIYYNPSDGKYDATSFQGLSAVYYDPITGKYDLSSTYVQSGYQYIAIANNLTESGTQSVAPVLTFDGTLAGLGHTIDGLQISTTSNYTGLIGQITGTASQYAVVRDLGVTDIYLDAAEDVGGIAGSATYTNFTNDYVTGEITSTTSAISFVGGLLGYGYYANVSYSFSDVAIVGPEAIGENAGALVYAGVGGLVGGLVYGNISNSDAVDDILCTTVCGGLLGGGGPVNITSSYHIGNVTGYDIITAYENGGIPDGTTADILGGLAGYVSQATVSYSFADGDVHSGGEFGGDNAYAGGLIGWASEAAISNDWANSNVTSEYGGGGGLVGTLESGSTVTSGWNSTTSISDSYATGTVTAETAGISGGSAGGLVGIVTGSTGTITISGSHSSDTVTGSTVSYHGNAAGGLIGVDSANTIISDSYATGDVSCGECSSGGLVGINEGTIANSYASGDVLSASDSAGGLVGVNEGAITDSSAIDGTVSAGTAGGLVGLNEGSISYSTSSDNVIATDHWEGTYSGDAYEAGGLVGVNWPTGTVDHSSASGDVTAPYADSVAGGIIGENLGAVTDSSGTGSVNVEGNSVDLAIGTSTGSAQVGTTSGIYTGTSSGISYEDIKAVEAQQAAEKAAAEAAARQLAAHRAAEQQAGSIANSVTASLAKVEVTQQISAQSSSAGTQAVTAAAPPIDANLAVQAVPAATPLPAQPSERRRVANAANRNRHGGSGGYGASIHSIDVNGRHFDLRTNSNKMPER